VTSDVAERRQEILVLTHHGDSWAVQEMPWTLDLASSVGGANRGQEGEGLVKQRVVQLGVGVFEFGGIGFGGAGRSGRSGRSRC